MKQGQQMGQESGDYIVKDHKKLRRGFTTGTCAAAAAQGAMRILLGLMQREGRGHGGTGEGDEVGLPISLTTPNGTDLIIPVLLVEDHRQVGSSRVGGSTDTAMPGACVTCAVCKDSGDDPDVTNGVMVYAKVTLVPDEQGCIAIDGGEGVGRVTKPGLACAVGQAAINPTPRRMIWQEVQKIASLGGYEGGISVEISIPAGAELAKRTYNPRLGIEGGISVLGTSGIVEPMSEQALVDTIKVEMNMCKAAGGQYLLLTPGNYGETFLKSTMGLGDVYTVKCSNFLGEALDYGVELGFRGILLVAHIGKLVKVAGGIMNTHSKYADARLEILAAHAARLGADRQTVAKMMDCVTTDDALAVLDACDRGESTGYSLREKTIESVLERVDFHIAQRVGHCLQTGAVMFSNQYGWLGQTKSAKALIEKL